MAVLNQYRLQPSGAGTNLIWSADLGLHYGLLTRNETLINKCRNLLVDEIRITIEDGIQPDFSFHQHKERLQIYHYGHSYLTENIRLAWQMKGTVYAFPEEKINILINYIFKGWQWMARGVNTVPGAIDRSVTRPGRLRYADIRFYIPFLKEIAPKDKKAFNSLLSYQDGKHALDGYQYYPYSDFAVYQQPKFSFFLKTQSSRTLSSEIINNENLHGRLMNSGDAYLIDKGDEYFDLMPVWNWNLLPGITAFHGAQRIDRKPYGGAVSNGRSGLSAMDYKLDGNAGQSVSAHKIWASHDGFIVCLVSNLISENLSESIYTVLNQCRLRGNVSVNTSSKPLPEGKNHLNGVRWIHHAGFAYILLEPAEVVVTLVNQTGSWFDINKSGSKELITEKVFTPIIKHSGAHKNGFGYVLAKCNTPIGAEKLSKKNSFNVLSNNGEVQAVEFKDGTLMGAIFSKTPAVVSGKIIFESDGPCLFQVSHGFLYISDPLHAGRLINIKINGVPYTVTLHADGTSSKVKLIE